jgi:ATP-dependent DNA helicase RecG
MLLALSPLLAPLRFLSRAGLSRLNTLRELEPLVARAVEAARPFAAAREESLSRLAQAARGFDSAEEPQRRAAVARLVRELSELVPLPGEIAALAAFPEQDAAPAIPEPRAALRAVSIEPPRMPAPAGRGTRAAAAEPEPLATPVDRLRGVGPALAERLGARGLATVGDLLLHLPRRYEDRRTPRTVAEAPLGERSLIAGTVVKAQEARGRTRRLEVLVRDAEGGHLVCLWFHFRAALLRRLAPGARVLVSGEVRAGYRGAGKTMHHPDVEPLAGEPGQAQLGDAISQARGAEESFGAVVPVYTEFEGVPPRTYRRIAHRAIEEYLRFVEDRLPPELLARRGLLGLQEALRESHFPKAFADAAARGTPGGEPHRRLAFEELFLVQLGLALKRRGLKVEPGIAFRAEPAALERVEKSLPWPLTSAQKRAVAAIAQDMHKPEPMNRLLQGDVGSGKTAVALCAALIAVEDGYQAAIMAPTEILAEQHARSLRPLLKGSGIHLELLTGGLSQRERAHGDRLVRGGAAQIVVGTHALAEEDTAFHKLGLVVIDEQHRFGVLTRQRLMTKGQRPDTLVMTATPIPRTLALTLYGDLDVSVLDELPPGRTPVQTRVYKDAARGKAYELIRRELGQGRQAYVVLPLVEESEKLADLKAATVERDRLAAEVFPGVPIGLVHGRQASAERNEAMERFRVGKDRILVATTVIEVGVDVPNATVMMIEHAERFGLSQLHQLRGRVGRGAASSHCLLVTGNSGAEWGPVARERLRVMEETSDGFRIAEADLELRGPGEFLGTRQSGLPDFAVAELARDQAILAEAREEAFALVQRDPELSSTGNAQLRDYLLHRWRGRLSLARVG